MSSPQTDYSHMFTPATYDFDAAAAAFDAAAQQEWAAATVIEDDDLMFGGKPLSEWYEEERQSATISTVGSSSSSTADGASVENSRQGSDAEEGEEELRGRQRVRPSYGPSGAKAKKSHRKQ